jgi:hypothetical protein
MTTLAEVKVVTADECGCEFTENPALHHHLLSIETMTAPHAGVVVAQMISDDDHGCGGTGKEFDDPGDFKRFMNQHIGVILSGCRCWLMRSGTCPSRRTRGAPDVLTHPRVILAPLGGVVRNGSLRALVSHRGQWGPGLTVQPRPEPNVFARSAATQLASTPAIGVVDA